MTNFGLKGIVVVSAVCLPVLLSICLYPFDDVNALQAWKVHTPDSYLINSLRAGDILQNSYSTHFPSMFCDINLIGMCYNDTAGWLFDIGLGNVLVPLGNKPLPGPMLSKFMTSRGLIGLSDWPQRDPEWTLLIMTGLWLFFFSPLIETFNLSDIVNLNLLSMFTLTLYWPHYFMYLLHIWYRDWPYHEL